MCVVNLKNYKLKSIQIGLTRINNKILFNWFHSGNEIPQTIFV